MRVQILYDRGRLFQASAPEMVSAPKSSFTSHAFLFCLLVFPSEEKESWIVGHLPLPKEHLL